ncbi:hypothetical protein P7C70_g1114, partial [Phenoliferia sp. Uapishka_3]
MAKQQHSKNSKPNLAAQSTLVIPSQAAPSPSHGKKNKDAKRERDEMQPLLSSEQTSCQPESEKKERKRMRKEKKEEEKKHREEQKSKASLESLEEDEDEETPLVQIMAKSSPSKPNLTKEVVEARAMARFQGLMKEERANASMATAGPSGTTENYNAPITGIAVSTSYPSSGRQPPIIQDHKKVEKAEADAKNGSVGEKSAGEVASRSGGGGGGVGADANGKKKQHRRRTPGTASKSAC